MQRTPRICVGLGAPVQLTELLTRAGMEVLQYGQRHHASLYVDFSGAQPSNISMVSIDLDSKAGRPPRKGADFSSDSVIAAACYIVGRALELDQIALTADPEMFTILCTALSVAPSHVPIIVEGETGTGKGLVVSLIHAASARSGLLNRINCTVLQDDQMDSEWLAARQSAFRPERANADAQPTGGGTLFLDEVGELSLNAQARLLRLVQESDSSSPTESIQRSNRLIVATNRSLTQMVGRGEFRSDLYWRLGVFTLSIPSLRNRNGDIVMLARFFLSRANPRRNLSLASLKMISSYPFPGNIRELHNLISRLAIVPLASATGVIDTSDVRRHLMIADNQAAAISGWNDSREEARREMVLRVLAACGGNRVDAARKLSITPRALQYHITKAGLSRPRAARRIASMALPLRHLHPVL